MADFWGKTQACLEISALEVYMRQSRHEKAILLDEVMKFNSSGGFWTASIKVFVPNAIGGI